MKLQDLGPCALISCSTTKRHLGVPLCGGAFTSLDGLVAISRCRLVSFRQRGCSRPPLQPTSRRYATTASPRRRCCSSGRCLLDLTDYCAVLRRLAALHSRAIIVLGPENSTPRETRTRKPADFADKLKNRSAREELEEQALQIEFTVSVSCRTRTHGLSTSAN